jgi:asparagine synthase (glutamine-hydrolysing)
MSGLFGIVDFAALRVESEAFRRLAESAIYRAPGGIGYQFLGEAGLASLARHPAETGSEQPLLDRRQQVSVLFDGRLDNRSELIASLLPAGGSDAADASLLLAAYGEWGEACTDHLLGDFAFAIWDAGRHTLLCAVDPLGIKPLHYARVGSLVCFGSDARQVLAHPAVPSGYSETEIAAYLAGQCEDPERSFFTAVHKLAPGQRLIATPEGIRVDRYWSPSPTEIRYSRDEDYAAHFLDLFQRSVTDRLRGAGSFAGVAMSGGLDSTSVAALAQRSPGARVRAYTFVFDRLAECDERGYSRAMTEELGLEVEPIEAERLWALDSQLSPPYSPDTPFTGWSSCYAEVFRRMEARKSRVLLMGHGGDQVLRGSFRVCGERLRRGDPTIVGETLRYARSRGETILKSFYRYVLRPALPVAADRLLRSAAGKREALLPSWVRPEFARRARLADRLRDREPRETFGGSARKDIYANLIGVPWYWRLANWHDRSAAAFGIEVRHPFLDQRLFEYVLAIPPEQLFRLDSSKNLLRRSMVGILPEGIRARAHKTGFQGFLDLALKMKSAGEIGEILTSLRCADAGVVDGKELRLAFLKYLDGKQNGSRGALWQTISLEVWLRRCEAHRAGGMARLLKTSSAAA